MLGGLKDRLLVLLRASSGRSSGSLGAGLRVEGAKGEEMLECVEGTGGSEQSARRGGGHPGVGLPVRVWERVTCLPCVPNCCSPRPIL